MNAVWVAGVVFASAVGGIVLGIILQRLLPQGHLNKESKSMIKLGTGLIATMAALVLGLLIGAAKSSFDDQRGGIQRLATDIILLDRTLAHYGPETAAARGELRRMVATLLDTLWPTRGSLPEALSNDSITANGGQLVVALQALPTHDDWHRGAQMHALQLGAELARQRWELSQPDVDSLPMAFLVVLAFWLFVLFTSFGLFSPRNGTVIGVLLVCALSVAGAVFLIVDMDQPFERADPPIQRTAARCAGAAGQIGTTVLRAASLGAPRGGGQPPPFWNTPRYSMHIRKYRSGEELELWELFFDSVRNVAIRDYSAEQVAAWAPDTVDEAHWRARIASNNPYVCEHDGQIVGYADLQPSGYIDHFFVHHQYQGQGVAKALFATIEAEAKRQQLAELWANVSITARPFFESRGFVVVAEQEVEVRQLVLRNFKMVKRLVDYRADSH